MNTYFFTYTQNNSGGFFKGDYKYVIVEAYDHDHADTLAEGFGLYFDGVSRGLDCECCGDRWGRAGTFWNKDRSQFALSPSDDPIPYDTNEGTCGINSRYILYRLNN